MGIFKSFKFYTQDEGGENNEVSPETVLPPIIAAFEKLDDDGKKFFVLNHIRGDFLKRWNERARIKCLHHFIMKDTFDFNVSINDHVITAQMLLAFTSTLTSRRSSTTTRSTPCST